MKNKKLIIGLGLGVGAYLLWNLKRKKMADNQLELDKSNQKPKSVESIPQTGGIKPSKPQLMNPSFVESLFKQANNHYRGGARPPQDVLDKINKDRMEALKEVEKLGLMSQFESWKKGEDAKKNKEHLIPSAPTGNRGGIIPFGKRAVMINNISM